MCDLVAHDNVNHSAPFIAAWLQFFFFACLGWPVCVCLFLGGSAAVALLWPTELPSTDRQVGSSVLIRRHETLRSATKSTPTSAVIVLSRATEAYGNSAYIRLLLLFVAANVASFVVFLHKKKIRYNSKCASSQPACVCVCARGIHIVVLV